MSAETSPAPEKKRPSKARKAAVFVLRWGIAIIGIWLVCSNIRLSDRVTYEDARHEAVEAAVRSGVPGGYLLEGEEAPVPEAALLMPSDRKYVARKSDGKRLEVLAVTPTDAGGTPAKVWASENARGVLDRWVFGKKAGPFVPVSPADLRDGYVVEAPFPTVEIGLSRMVREARTGWLLASVLIMPVIYLITGYRWWLLLGALELPISLWLAMQINMVGAFYNTFMPGSTGGDVLKAYYAAKNVRTHRTRAVMSVVVDRAIGLVALIMMGGVAASFQWQVERCRQVAIAAGCIVGLLTLGVLVVGVTPVRKALGLDFVLKRLPLREKLAKATDAMRLYKRRAGLVLWTLVISFPVHATVVLSAMFAGWAFGLPLRWEYYWVIVPTVVLAGALPLSPQGAGVMEFFAILLARPQGATVGQAVALTLSIRLVQIVWNLFGGVLVFFGDYHAPTKEEEKVLETPDETDAGPAVA